MTDPAPGARARGNVPDAGDPAVRHGDGEAPRAGEEALFAALDRTRSDLAAAPRPTAPDGLTGSILAALADRGTPTPEDTGNGRTAVRTAPSSGPSRRRAGRPATRRRVLAGLVGLAAAAVLAVVVLPSGGDAPAPRPAPGRASDPDAPVVLASGDLPQALRSGLGAHGGPADPARRAGCLAANGLPPGTVPLGSRAVVLDGRPGTLYVLATGQLARFRLLVVGPGCGPGTPDRIQDTTVGG